MSADRMRKGPSLSSTGNPHFCTPEWVLEPVRALDPRGRIALDPCSNAKSIVSALTEWRGPRARQHRGDGLALPWGPAAHAALARHARVRRQGRAAQLRTPLVYVNPPFTRDVIGKWIEKCAAEALDELRPMHIVALVPARMSSAWWRARCYPGGGSAAAVCFLSRRVRFRGALQGCPWEMALVYWGADPIRFAEETRFIGGVYALATGRDRRLLEFFAPLGPPRRVAARVDSAR